MANATFNSQANTASVNPATYVNMVGGTISIVVLIGVVAWGAQTLMRDSTGVPVVSALDGPLRIAPLDPGGVSATHQGLTVNEVASSQNPAVRIDPFQLAPRPISLKEEDQPVVLTNVENIPLPIPAEKIQPSPVMAGTTIEELIASLAEKTDVQNNIKIIPVGVGFRTLKHAATTTAASFYIFISNANGSSCSDTSAADNTCYRYTNGTTRCVQ